MLDLRPGKGQSSLLSTETTCGIEILLEVCLSVTISTDKYAGFDIIAVRSVPLLFASSRDFLYQRDWNQVFSHMNFSKDIVLKSDGRISLFPNFKKMPQTFALLLFT